MTAPRKRPDPAAELAAVSALLARAAAVLLAEHRPLCPAADLNGPMACTCGFDAAEALREELKTRATAAPLFYVLDVVASHRDDDADLTWFGPRGTFTYGLNFAARFTADELPAAAGAGEQALAVPCEVAEAVAKRQVPIDYLISMCEAGRPLDADLEHERPATGWSPNVRAWLPRPTATSAAIAPWVPPEEGPLLDVTRSMSREQLERFRARMNGPEGAAAVAPTLAALDGTPAGAWGERFEAASRFGQRERCVLVRVPVEVIAVKDDGYQRLQTSVADAEQRIQSALCLPATMLGEPRYATLSTATTRPEVEAIAELVGGPTTAGDTDPPKETP